MSYMHTQSGRLTKCSICHQHRANGLPCYDALKNVQVLLANKACVIWTKVLFWIFTKTYATLQAWVE